MNKKRNQIQDTLRGFIVALACLEHFSMYLNLWYREHFHISNMYSHWMEPSTVELYEHHSSLIGTHLPVDSLSQLIGILFIPWITHLYIALSGFNLARKTTDQSFTNLKPCLKFYGLFGLLFLAEGLIANPDFGWGLILFPITILFFLLAITHTIYALFKLKGVVSAFMVVLIINIMTNSGLLHPPTLSKFMQSIHPWAIGSTEPLSYLGDCLGGLILGSIFFQKHWSRTRVLKILAISFVLAIIAFLQVKNLFIINPNLVSNYDSVLHQNNWGLLFIYSIMSLIFCLCHLLQNVQTPAFLKLFEWISLNSLGIFLVHRILFIKILAPIRLHIGSYFGMVMTNSFFELCLIYFPLTLLIYWCLKRIKFFGNLIMKEL